MPKPPFYEIDHSKLDKKRDIIKIKPVKPRLPQELRPIDQKAGPMNQKSPDKLSPDFYPLPLGHNLPEVLERLRALKTTKGVAETRREWLGRFLEISREEFQKMGGLYYQDVNSLYQIFKKEKLLVRRENPERLIESLTEQKDLAISFDPKVSESYANCAEWSYEYGSRGLENAFLEGYSELGGLVMVAGFKQGPNLKVEEIPGNYKLFYGLDRQFVRSAKGLIHPNEIKFVVLRFPSTFFPKEQMTERELDKFETEEEKPQTQRKTFYIFRGFGFTPAG